MTTLDLLEKFAAGWNAHDVEALLECMTNDGIFYGSAGAEPDGATSRGIEELRTPYSALWAMFPDAAWNDVQHFISGERAVTEWRFTGTRADGSKVNVRGCDVFLIRDSVIVVNSLSKSHAMTGWRIGWAIAPAAIVDALTILAQPQYFGINQFVQGAGFMADGYARASRKPGVAMFISGPGVTNASTAIGQAYSDSVPVLLLTAAIATGAQGMGRGMLHEITDQRALTAPITSFSAMAYKAEQVPQHFARAFAKFGAERPRPVHISVPLDVLEKPVDDCAAPKSLPKSPGADPALVVEIAELLKTAQHPVILAGGGAVSARTALQKLVERCGAMFVSTVAGKGILPESHPQSVGSTLQRLPTCKYIAKADLVVAFGTEISEPDLYITADVEAAGDVDPALLEPKLVMTGKFVRIDIDPDVVVRDYDPDIALLADARLAAEAILAGLASSQTDTYKICVRIADIEDQNLATLSPLERTHNAVLQAVREGLPEDALVYADMTQIGYTGCGTFPVEQPACWHFPMGFGTLGYALPAAIGGQIACPERATAVIVGDGGFQFISPELATAVEQRLPIPIILWDNDALGEIADFMKARQIPQVDVYPENPDFEDMARAYHCGYVRVATSQAVTQAVQNALRQDRPTLIHVHQNEIRDTT